ncbi:MAG: signal peptidase I [Clostridium sp.]|nr:signal peptidase I [Clostridium sp.]
MKSSEKKVAIIEIVTLVIILLDIFVTNKIGYLGLSILLITALLISIGLLGYEKSRQLFTKDVLMTLIIYCILYYLIIYISGIWLGFLRSGYNLKLIGIIRNITPVLIIIFASEFLRYELIQKGKENKFLIILTCLLFVSIDSILVSYLYDLHTTSGIIKMLYATTIPLLSKNILLTYMSLKFGYKPPLVYRLFMEIPTFLLPIVPDIDIYMQTVINLLFPALIMYKLYTEFKKKKTNENIRNNNKVEKILSIGLVIIIFLMISLTSGIFKFYVLAIGSESMEPRINKGDVVVVEKLNEKEIRKLKEGEVLVYKHNDMVIVHRIVRVKEYNGVIYFNTKGDNNSEEDSWTIDEALVIGKATLKIPYLGVPTVWLNEKV